MEELESIGRLARANAVYWTEGIYGVCFGDHHRSEGCDYKAYVPKNEAERILLDRMTNRTT